MRMTNKLRMLGFMIVLAGCAMFLLAGAAEWNKGNTVMFSAPVAIPGQVLPPGRYVFKLADPQSDRPIVQIFTEDQSALIATVLSIPAYRLEPTDDTHLTFEVHTTGKPEA